MCIFCSQVSFPLKKKCSFVPFPVSPHFINGKGYERLIQLCDSLSITFSTKDCILWAFFINQVSFSSMGTMGAGYLGYTLEVWAIYYLPQYCPLFLVHQNCLITKSRLSLDYWQMTKFIGTTRNIHCENLISSLALEDCYQLNIACS